jgi:hypothetical protein
MTSKANLRHMALYFSEITPHLATEDGAKMEVIYNSRYLDASQGLVVRHRVRNPKEKERTDKEGRVSFFGSQMFIYKLVLRDTAD